MTRAVTRTSIGNSRGPRPPWRPHSHYWSSWYFSSRCCLRDTQPSAQLGNPGDVAIHIALKKLARSIVADVALVVDQVRREVQIDFRLRQGGYIEISKRVA